MLWSGHSSHKLGVDVMHLQSNVGRCFDLHAYGWPHTWALEYLSHALVSMIMAPQACLWLPATAVSCMRATSAYVIAELVKGSARRFYVQHHCPAESALTASYVTTITWHTFLAIQHNKSSLHQQVSWHDCPLGPKISQLIPGCGILPTNTWITSKLHA